MERCAPSFPPPKWNYTPPTEFDDCNDRCAYGTHYDAASKKYYKLPEQAVLGWRHNFVQCLYCGTIASTLHAFALHKPKATPNDASSSHGQG